MKANLQSILGIAVVTVAGVLNSSASSVSYDFGSVSGGATPAGTPPWAEAVFSDAGANTVTLTLTAGGLGQGSFVSSWYFNLNPSLDSKSLDFTVSGSTGAFTGPSIMTGANGFKAGPDGKFDILFGFATTGDDSALFGSGDSLTYTISGISGLTADDFNQLSTSASGSGAYASAAHVQPGSTDVSCPAWINPTATSLLDNAATPGTVPDASSTIALLGTSLVAIGILRRKFQSAR